MAHMSQENKKSKAPAIKAICKKYGVKATLGVHHHSTLVLNISAGEIDFIKNYNETAEGVNRNYFGMSFVPATGYIDVNEYHFKNHFTGSALDFLIEVVEVMNTGNFDNSDPMTDFFHVGWYIDINIGKWNKPYQLITTK